MLGRGFGHQRAGGRDRLHARADRSPPRILAVGPWPWLFADQRAVRPGRASASALRCCRRRRARGHRFDFVGALLAAGCLGLFILAIGSAAHKRRRRRSWPSSWSPALVLGFTPDAPSGRPSRRRCCRSTCSAGRCSRCRRRPRSAPSPCRASPSSRCRSISRTCSDRSQVETGFFMTPWPLVVGIMAPIAGRLSDRYPAGLLGGIGLVAARPRHGAARDAAGATRASPTSSGAWRSAASASASSRRRT